MADSDTDNDTKKQDLLSDLEQQEGTLLSELSNFTSVTKDVKQSVLQAKQFLSENKIAEAEIAIFKAKTRIAEAKASKDLLAKSYFKNITFFWVIFAYNIFFILIAGALYWLILFGPVKLQKLPDNTFPPVWLAPWLLLGFTSGILGGSLISLYGLVQHSVAGDFDPSYKIWYWFKPLIGALSGSIASMPLFSGILIFNITEKQSVVVATIVLIAFLAGFYERFFLEIINRIGEVILKPGEPASKT